MDSDQPKEIFKGTRNDSFKRLITDLLKRGNLRQKYIDSLTDQESMQQYDKAFTAPSANPEENYEIFEQLGDLSINKFIVWYAYRRFPQLDCPAGVKVVARLRINYGSRQSFAEIADNLGFWDFISADEEDRMRKKKDILEDCMESFIGCTEFMLDKKYRPGVGYAIVYDILTSIFDEIPMSLKYNELYDAKTRIKELFDLYKDKLGSWTFTDTRDDMLAISTVYRVPPGSSKNVIKVPKGGGVYEEKIPRDWVKLGVGRAAKKSDAQQRAAEEGLKKLNQEGWVKQIPEEYKFFCS